MTTLSENRKAKFQYEFLEEFEAGILLMGPEIKPIMDGKIDLSGAYVVIRDNAAWMHLSRVEVPPKAGFDIITPDRPRKLLLHSHEIKGLKKSLDQKGLSCIPVRVIYTEDRPKKTIKVILQLARGRKAQDKREYLKEKEIRRESRQEF